MITTVCDCSYISAISLCIYKQKRNQHISLESTNKRFIDCCAPITRYFIYNKYTQKSVDTQRVFLSFFCRRYTHNLHARENNFTFGLHVTSLQTYDGISCLFKWSYVRCFLQISLLYSIRLFEIFICNCVGKGSKRSFVVV